MAPATAREGAVLDHMRARFDHVSAERLLSGPGLVELYDTLAEIDGVPAVSYTSAQITDPGVGKGDPRCRDAVDMFCAMLGTIAGNLALTLGARGGIYIAGGIVPKLGAAFAGKSVPRALRGQGSLAPLPCAYSNICCYPSVPRLHRLGGSSRCITNFGSGALMSDARVIR